MKIKKFFNLQIVKIKRTASVGAVILLVLNFTLNLFPYVEHHGIHPYLAMISIFIFMMILVWIGSHIYVKHLEMYKYETLAEKIYNPYAVYSIGPFEEMIYRHEWIPKQEAIHSMMKDGKDKDIFKKEIEIFKKWVKLGYIPKSDFPEHLKKYYITKIEERL